jgi:hypothetical protein
MLCEDLDRALKNVDLNTDQSAWSRFCEWANTFHDIDINKLTKFNDFSAFEKHGGVELPLKYLESIKDLWVKWSKAVESDMIDR